jgi:hypothetical protein
MKALFNLSIPANFAANVSRLRRRKHDRSTTSNSAVAEVGFEPKVSNTIQRSFRQTINQTLKTLLLPMADEQADATLQQYNQARAYLEQTLEKKQRKKSTVIAVAR